MPPPPPANCWYSEAQSSKLLQLGEPQDWQQPPPTVLSSSALNSRSGWMVSVIAHSLCSAVPQCTLSPVCVSLESNRSQMTNEDRNSDNEERNFLTRVIQIQSSVIEHRPCSP